MNFGTDSVKKLVCIAPKTFYKQRAKSSLTFVPEDEIQKDFLNWSLKLIGQKLKFLPVQMHSVHKISKTKCTLSWPSTLWPKINRLPLPITTQCEVWTWFGKLPKITLTFDPVFRIKQDFFLFREQHLCGVWKWIGKHCSLFCPPSDSSAWCKSWSLPYNQVSSPTTNALKLDRYDLKQLTEKLKIRILSEISILYLICHAPVILIVGLQL